MAKMLVFALVIVICLPLQAQQYSVSFGVYTGVAGSFTSDKGIENDPRYEGRFETKVVPIGVNLGIDYEAFNTSGGVGTLGATLAGRIRNLNYKTIRYPGHCEIMKRLIGDLRLDEATLTEVFGYALPRASRDVVLILVSATGKVGGEPREETLMRKIHSRDQGGVHWSAIQITTASAICAALDLVREGRLPRHGFVRQEDVTLPDFLANRFGQAYA